MKKIITIIIALLVVIGVANTLNRLTNKLQKQEPTKIIERLTTKEEGFKTEILLQKLRDKEKLIISQGVVNVKETLQDKKWYGKVTLDFDLKYHYNIVYDFEYIRGLGNTIILNPKYLKVESVELDNMSTIKTKKSWFRGNLPSETIDFYMDQYKDEVLKALNNKLNNDRDEYLKKVENFIYKVVDSSSK